MERNQHGPPKEKMKKYFIKEKITIGVSAFGNLMSTKNCIQAIKNSLDGAYEVILIDDFLYYENIAGGVYAVRTPDSNRKIAAATVDELIRKLQRRGYIIQISQ